MATPRDANARKYYRVAKQRLEEARLIFDKIGLSAATVYLAGYAIECMLKALTLEWTPVRQRPEMLKSLKDDFGHNLRRLRAALVEQNLHPPREVLGELLYACSWSPDLRYEPGPGDPKEAERFLAAAKSIVIWADGRI